MFGKFLFCFIIVLWEYLCYYCNKFVYFCYSVCVRGYFWRKIGIGIFLGVIFGFLICYVVCLNRWGFKLL